MAWNSTARKEVAPQKPEKMLPDPEADGGKGGFGLGKKGCGSVCRREGAQRDRDREKEKEKEIWVMLPPKD